MKDGHGYFVFVRTSYLNLGLVVCEVDLGESLGQGGNLPDVTVLLVLECLKGGLLSGGDLLGEFRPIDAGNCNPSRSHFGVK